jgi:hypothetical protein
MTTSALAPRILPLRSASNPDITDRAMMGAAVPRKTPKMEMAVNTVKVANRTPRYVTTPPRMMAMMPPWRR